MTRGCPGACSTSSQMGGGKTQSIERLLRYLPQSGACIPYYEPFLGGGSMFFALRPTEAYLSDANPHLISFYRQIAASPDLVGRYIREFARHHSREQYYVIRAQYNTAATSPRQATRFLYLNKYSYNGVFRVNRQGEFNVPHGERRHYSIPTTSQLRMASATLRRAQLVACSDQEALASIKPGALVYLDPPYPPLNGTSFFTHYTPDRFSQADQERLAKEVRRLDRLGAKVMMTNADTALIRALYSTFDVHCLSVTRYVTCKKKNTECLNSLS